MRGARARAPPPSRSALELGLGLDVDAEDAVLEREGDLVARSCRRRRRRSAPAGTPAASARRSSPSETTSTPAPSRASVRDHGQVGVGLHRVADQRSSRPGERRRAARGSAAPASRWNSSRTACRPPRRCAQGARPRAWSTPPRELEMVHVGRGQRIERVEYGGLVRHAAWPGRCPAIGVAGLGGRGVRRRARASHARRSRAGSSVPGIGAAQSHGQSGRRPCICTSEPCSQSATPWPPRKQPTSRGRHGQF